MTGKDVLRYGAPIIAAGGVWVAQRTLQYGYQAATGNDVPRADDLDAPVSRVIVFAAAAAVLAAVINTVVTREVAKAGQPRSYEGVAA